MNILPRGVRVARAASRKNAAEATVSQRIEITVERETITVLVRGQRIDNEEGTAGGNDRPVSRRPELLPPSPESEDEDKKLP
ncbi:MAG: hypothetical protein ABSC77_01275 [Terracidiphilus sp.]|jgi:hypothetical protein